MIGDRERDALNEIGAIWLGNGVELATRMAALADHLDEMAGGLGPTNRSHALTYGVCAGLIRDTLTTEYDPTTGRRTPLHPALEP